MSDLKPHEIAREIASAQQADGSVATTDVARIKEWIEQLDDLVGLEEAKRLIGQAVAERKKPPVH